VYPSLDFTSIRSDQIHSQLEKQANEQLSTVYQQLLQAGVDKNESDREIKLKEVIASLQRVFTG
jgi:structural maintenance of chromosome 1